MITTYRFTTADLENFPERLDDTRYEIIDGELYVSRQPSAKHQGACTELTVQLANWSRRSGLGQALFAPGVIFAEDDNVAPDVVWYSYARKDIIGPDGKFHDAPELIAEVLSPGEKNAERDRDSKLKLYSRRGVREYWILDWQRQTVDVFRRAELAAPLEHVTTLGAEDHLTSPLLPGFTCRVGELFRF